MAIEIQMLVYSVALFIVTVAIQATAGVLQMGLMPALGNRDDIAPATGFTARAKRCVMNSVEAMVMFVPLALAAVAAQQTDQWSALGAQIFFYARVGYVACYLIGIPVLRTILWTAGLAGVALVLYAMFV
ncbi:MAG: MAPEG family protein [Alphaproteobacteria bacterium]